jgi:hypothetical protein
LASAAIVALLCLPGAVLAQRTPRSPKGRGGSGGSASSLLTQELELRGSNGYKIRVTLLNREDLSIEASNINLKKGTFGVVSYELTAPQKSGSDDIDARIGNLGRVRLRFVGEGPKREKPACKGGERVTETGHYVGSISFRGKDGFTQARAHRVKGTVESEMGRTCSPGQFGFVSGQATTKPGKGSNEKASELLGQEENEGQLTALLQGSDVTFSAVKSNLTFKKKEIRSTNYFVLAGRKPRADHYRIGRRARRN